MIDLGLRRKGAVGARNAARLKQYLICSKLAQVQAVDLGTPDTYMMQGLY